MTGGGYFVTGTDTGVGKTRISAALLHAFAARGLRAVGMKPVAAGCEWANGVAYWEDVEQLRAAASVEAAREHINPYRFDPPVAPHIAAAEQGVAIRLDTIAHAFAALQAQADVVVVEGAGGFRVPLNDHEDMADMARTLALPVILVVGMRLGCINHALLTTESIRHAGLPLAGWVANRIDPGMAAFDANLTALEVRLDAPLLGVVPWLAEAAAATVAGSLDVDKLVRNKIIIV